MLPFEVLKTTIEDDHAVQLQLIASMAPEATLIGLSIWIRSALVVINCIATPSLLRAHRLGERERVDVLIATEGFEG
jgi:hypothetical protein